jgi:uncharacterized membrane protein
LAVPFLGGILVALGGVCLIVAGFATGGPDVVGGIVIGGVFILAGAVIFWRRTRE